MVVEKQQQQQQQERFTDDDHLEQRQSDDEENIALIEDENCEDVDDVSASVSAPMSTPPSTPPMSKRKSVLLKSASKVVVTPVRRSIRQTPRTKVR